MVSRASSRLHSIKGTLSGTSGLSLAVIVSKHEWPPCMPCVPVIGVTDEKSIGLVASHTSDGDDNEGDTLGDAEGDALGNALGDTLGDALGDALGEVLGDALGDELGGASGGVGGEGGGGESGGGGGHVSTRFELPAKANNAPPVVRLFIWSPDRSEKVKLLRASK